MSNEELEFGGFLLEPAERRLTRDGALVEVSGRYLDALLLLARHPGELIAKDRFMAEVWRGIPVTDEALTQCIRSLRKALGDEAARPRFIQTVPRHGYRFVAAVTARGVERSGSGGLAGADSALAGQSLPPTPSPADSPDPAHPSDPRQAPAETSLQAAADAAGSASAEAAANTAAHAPNAANAAKATPRPAAAGPATATGSQLKGDSTFNLLDAEHAPVREGAGCGGVEGSSEGSPLPLSVKGGAGGRSDLLLIAAAGLVGGAAAGLVGGIGYGLIAATEPPAGTGAVSILLVMTCLCLLVGVLGGLGVGSGAALGRLIGPGRLFPLMAGGAAGGLVVGAAGRLIGLDAFSLLIGSRPLAITGGSEGLLIGALAGAALWLVEREPTAPPSAAAGKGALLGAVAGLLVALGGGKMMAGSLAGLAAAHPQAPLGRLLGELPPPLLLAAGAIEGAIFIAALTVAFLLALRGRRSG